MYEMQGPRPAWAGERADDSVAGALPGQPSGYGHRSGNRAPGAGTYRVTRQWCPFLMVRIVLLPACWAAQGVRQV